MLNPHMFLSFFLTCLLIWQAERSSARAGSLAPVWSEEFNKPLDLTTPDHEGKWRVNAPWQNPARGYRDFAGASWNINPAEDGYAEANPFSIKDSILSIRMRRVPPQFKERIRASMAANAQIGPTPDWMGGLLMVNAAKHTFRYGYFEIRARWPDPGKGMFPALWLYAVNENGPKPHAEIDILEIFGDPKAAQWRSTLHWSDASGMAHAEHWDAPGGERDDLTQWHVFGFDWTPDALRLYCDGILRREIKGPIAQWFDAPMTLILNYSMDAPWFAKMGRRSDAATPDQMSMEVNYVQFYSHKPE